MNRSEAWVRWRKAWARQFWQRNNGCGEDRLREWKVKRIGRLRGLLGNAVTARDIAERQLRECRIGVDRRLGLFFGGPGLLGALGFDARFIVRSQNLRATQIFVSVNVLGFLCLFAFAFLARGFGYILGGLGAALRSAEKETGAKNDCVSASKRLAKRHPRMHVRLAGTGEVSFCHCQPTAGGHPMAEYYWKIRLLANGIF
jgi:hypothetical protein